MRSGRRTPIDEIPTPAFAVPYAAPKHVNTMALVQPIAPKKGYIHRVSSVFHLLESRTPSVGARGTDDFGRGTVRRLWLTYRVLAQPRSRQLHNGELGVGGSTYSIYGTITGICQY